MKTEDIRSKAEAEARKRYPINQNNGGKFHRREAFIRGAEWMNKEQIKMLERIRMTLRGKIYRGFPHGFTVDWTEIHRCLFKELKKLK